MHNMDWSNLRYVLAVAREGSAAAAARALAVNHSTVVRRVRSFEAQLEIRLFDHLASGYRLTPSGEVFLDAARAIEGTLAELGRKVAMGEDALAGDVRVTTTDSLFLFLSEDFAAFRQDHPRVTLDLLVTNHQLDLSGLDADIAIRPTHTPPEELVGRRVCGIGYALYATPALLAAAGPDDLPWLGFGGPISASSLGRWMEETSLTGEQVMRCNSFTILLALARLGTGCAVLPCFIGDAVAELRRVTSEPIEFRNQLWLLSHADVLRSRRVRMVSDFLFESLHARRAIFEGETPTRAG